MNLKLARFFLITLIIVRVENIWAYINPCKLQLLFTHLTEEITQHEEQIIKMNILKNLLKSFVEKISKRQNNRPT